MLIAGIIVILDQLTKFLAIRYIRPAGYFPVTPFFWLTYVENDGTVFGMFRGNNFFFAVANIIILAIFFWQYRNGFLRGQNTVMGLICGGAVGNLVDRLGRGRVIDFFDFRFFPVFNVADSAVTVASIFLAWALIRGAVHSGALPTDSEYKET